MATERLERVRSVALGVWIAGGSRLEPPELAGVSHFIEHLIFKGSDAYSAFDIAHLFDDMGAEPNASTSKEHTLVNARLLDEDLPKAVELLAEMVVRPSFAELDQEREVVLEEVAMYEDSPPELVHDDLAEVVFGAHPLGQPILGHSTTLRGLGVEEVRTYHDEHYVDAGIVVAAAGNVDNARLVELVRTSFRGGDDAPVPRPRLAEPPARHIARFSKKDTEQYHLCLGGIGPRRDAGDRYAAFVVDTILGGSWSSRLFQEVREKRGLAYSVYSYTSLYADAGLVAIYVGSREEAVSEAFTIVLDVLHDLESDLSDEAVERAKNHLKGQTVLNMESPGSRMQALGRSILMGMPVLTVDDILARIDGVTRDDVLAAAARYYDPAGWSATCIGPDLGPLHGVTDGFIWEER